MADLDESMKLDLPDWSEKDPAPALSAAKIAALCERMLPVWNAERFKSPPPPLPDWEFVLD